MWERLARLAPLTGAVFVALFMVGIVVSGNTPGSDATGKAVISFYRDNKGAQNASNLVFAIAGLFFLFFGATLRTHLARARGSTALPTAAFGGAVVLAAGATILTGTGFALTDTPGTLDPAAAQALNVLNSDLFAPLVLGGGVFMIACGLVIVRGGTVWRWLGWLALPIGVLLLTPVGFIAGIVFLAWVLLVSILVFLRDRRIAAPSAPA